MLELPQPGTDAYELLTALGQNLAFALVAGRCSAAQAALLARLRDEKKYLKFGCTWREFCPKYLNISGSQADHIVSLWKQFGAGIFELKQLIRISPEGYRAVEPSIKDGALHFNGEAIDLDPENAAKIAAAAAELRRTAPPKPPRELTVVERLAELDKQCTAIASEFEKIARQKCRGEELLRLELTLNRASAALQRIEMDHGLYPKE